MRRLAHRLKTEYSLHFSWIPDLKDITTFQRGICPPNSRVRRTKGDWFYSRGQNDVRGFLPYNHPVYSHFEKGCGKKVHATIPKGIVGGFEFTLLQRNLKEWHERPWTYVCECLRKATKLGSTATALGNSVLIISHITFRSCRVKIFSDNLSRNSCIQPGSLFWPKRKAIQFTKFLFRRIQHVGRRKRAPLYCSRCMIAYWDP